MSGRLRVARERAAGGEERAREQRRGRPGRSGRDRRRRRTATAAMTIARSRQRSRRPPPAAAFSPIRCLRSHSSSVSSVQSWWPRSRAAGDVLVEDPPDRRRAQPPAQARARRAACPRPCGPQLAAEPVAERHAEAVLLRARISARQQVVHRLLQARSCPCRPRRLSASGSVATYSIRRAVEQGAARLQAVGHRHAVHLGQQVVEQVGARVQVEQAGEERARRRQRAERLAIGGRARGRGPQRPRVERAQRGQVEERAPARRCAPSSGSAALSREAPQRAAAAVVGRRPRAGARAATRRRARERAPECGRRGARPGSGRSPRTPRRRRRR